MKQYDILIVDDEQRYVDMLARRLEMRGCSCQVSYDGTHALEIFRNSRFLLIVLDLCLPDMYGTEVLVRMKEICPQIPVIILTGHGSEKDRLECMDQGAHAFFHKPLDIGKLLGILEQVRKEAK